MSETDRLTGCISQIDLDVVEREATPRLFMKLGIQLHLTCLSLAKTASILDVFSIHFARSTVHNWVHKAKLQPVSGQHPDHVAVDETVIQLDGERYWLYAAVDVDTNDLLHTKLVSTRNKVLANSFFAELREKHDVDDAGFLFDGDHSLQYAYHHHHRLTFRYERQGIQNSAERVFREVKRRTFSFFSSFSHAQLETADQWLGSLAFAKNRLI
ncbi:IS6 family transposase [Halovivax limisalsi]|uniref:IS6 family transposase n=1 Tax=Halovivax limisalsi TaxID=1453760 RepID=UPI001FFDCF6C|nr:IS6 family transposase [Halovivax limisalsi]